MTTNDRIKGNCQVIREIIEVQCNTDDASCLLENLMKLKAVGGLAAETVALANRALKEKQVEIMKRDDPELKRIDQLFGKTGLKVWIETECKQELAQVDYVMYLDKRLSYSIDAVRTAISHLKEQMGREYGG